ncbi:translocation and assembly module lipoprotein TamL [Tenacibaculum maritimum]|uniref:translocation and assembly module lipoprotein TamL n=1 Tax=Tenacibaculum maritimum TaxID=107401 RepID=UPI0012E68B6C|nr:BamA/TamA family outer membrane protein [Tenacibaculum maritimum]CAA0177546.1 conserved hypothetical protein [Tenacibaculum maritimum]CAA0182631.1 conserved hypothetical protein [Tenacibaculum maritimum]CAA0182902.1 conserved hypothetical protein [Tenacibaculum maritimum]CAA0249069.1 conserved hypothetical protein [Tenacibaculum maritimum]
MKNPFFYFLFLILIISCNSVKRVPEGKELLVKNIIYIDSLKSTNSNTEDYIIQRPNSKTLGFPLALYFYNLGKPNGPKNPYEWSHKNPKLYNFFEKSFSQKQSIALANTFIGVNNWFLKSGQAPVIIDNKKTEKTVKNLQTYYQTEGYFRAKVKSKKSTTGYKKGTISYFITKGTPTIIDSISTRIASKDLDSLYNAQKSKTFIKSGEQYKNQNFINEANRLTKLFRDNGIYHFSENYIGFYEIDTASTNNHKTDVHLEISNRIVEGNNGVYTTKPLKIQKVKKINIFTDYTYNERNSPYLDTVSHNGISFISHKKLAYNPKFLSQSIFIKPNGTYSDYTSNLTRKHLRGLRNFKTTAIKYSELNDSELIADIYLTPIEKYTLGFETELSRSNIRNFDISAKFSITNRNTFKGAEIFKFSVLGSYFNSRNGPGWEIGGNLSLEVPRFMVPFGLHKMVPKSMFPKTKFSTGLSIQKNIGLDKQNITVGIDYKWQFNKKKSIQLELMNAQYIRNLNIENYFTVYNSEYSKLEEIAKAYDTKYTLPENIPSNANGIVAFMNKVLQDRSSITENPIAYGANLNIFNRYRIITSNFLIPEIAYSYTYNNQENIKDVSFSFFKLRFANSGNVMGIFSKHTNSNGLRTVFKIPVAQYFKTDIEYKKFWSTSENTALGYRAFLGAAIPYGKSNIPFSKSYFAGGSNDIRAWQTYDLGPGTRAPGLEYNIGSLKFLTSLEYRFDIINNLKGALFIDAGNIWDITNSSFVDAPSKFTDISSLKDMAVGTGFGFRYDFKFLIARLDIGLKAHEPYLKDTNRWFRNFNFNRAVYNIGINYPF